VDLQGLDAGRVGGLLKLRVAEEEMIFIFFREAKISAICLEGKRLLVAVDKIVRSSVFKSDRLLAAETVFP
jgi:hypothetical protein